MPISVTCPSCSKTLKAKDEYAGKKTKCPGCGTVLKIPTVELDDEHGPFGNLPDEYGMPEETIEKDDRKPCPACGERIKNNATKCRFCGEALDHSYLSVQRPSPPMFYAGFWMRVAAAFLDGIILTLLGGVAGGILGAVIGGMMGGANKDQVFFVMMTANTIILEVLRWLYDAYFESSEHQATPGKMALGLYVTDLDGEPISFLRATGRHFGKLLSQFTCFIGYLMVAFTPQKQALHDMLAGCLVLRR